MRVGDWGVGSRWRTLPTSQIQSPSQLGTLGQKGTLESKVVGQRRETEARRSRGGNKEASMRQYWGPNTQ